MVGFLGAQALYDQEFDAQNNFLIFGVGPAADCIRESSLYISPHSPALRRNFNNFYAFDSQERLQDASLVLGETSADFQLPVIYVGGTICAPYMTCWLGEAYEINALPPERTVWYVGCRDYSPEEGEWARYNQRFLPSSELEVEVALKTALAESVWGDNIDQADSLDFIYSQVKNLRRKMKQAGAVPQVKAVYGFGYKLVTEERPPQPSPEEGM